MSETINRKRVGNTDRTADRLSYLERTDKGVFIIDTDGVIRFANSAIERIVGYPPAELVDQPFSTPLPASIWGSYNKSVIDGTSKDTTGIYQSRIPLQVYQTNNDVRDLESSIVRFDDDERMRYLCVIRDGTANERYNQKLGSLFTTIEQLLRATSGIDAIDRAVETIGDIHEVQFVGVRLFNPENEQLTLVSSVDERADRLGVERTYARREGPIGTAFELEEPVYQIYDGDYDSGDNLTSLKSALYLPIGSHGIISVGSDTTDVLSELTIHLGKLLATATEIALDRLQREHHNHERTQALQQNDETSTATQFDALQQETLQSVLSATTREDVERLVCEQFANSSQYDVAFITDNNTRSQSPVIRAQAGDESITTDELLATQTNTNGHFPEVEVQTWEAKAFDSDRQQQKYGDNGSTNSVIRIPLRYGEAVYGSLYVYGPLPYSPSPKERSMLETFGTILGFIINSHLHKEVLFSGSAIELELAITTPEELLVQLATDTRHRITVEGMCPAADGMVILYIHFNESLPDNMGEAIDSNPHVTQWRTIHDVDSRNRIELVTRKSAIGTFLQEGGVVVEADADADAAHLRVRLPPTLDTKTVLDRLRNEFQKVRLLKKQITTPSYDNHTDHNELTDRLTEKQLTALRTAYLAGYYDWPRESTAEDIASSMGISSATLHNHIRKATNSVLGEIFDA